MSSKRSPRRARRNFSRRDFIQGLAALSGAGAGAVLLNSRALAQTADDPRFLIVLCAGGGGSIIDGPLAIRESESANASTINCFPDAMLTRWEGSPFTVADVAMDDIGPIPSAFSVTPSEFFSRRREQLMVSTWTRTSVNHSVGQRRSVTGNEAWTGRTLQELVAWQYGIDAPIPNAHLVAGLGYTEAGTDDAIPTYARGQLVANPALWPLSLDGAKGQPHAVNAEVLDAIRKHRNEVFEPATAFEQVFTEAPRIVEWHELRARQAQIEASDLITKLMVRPDGPDFPLGDFGLESSPEAEAVRAAFPDYAIDPLQSQAALAFLLLKYRVSVSVTLGPSFEFVYKEDEDDFLGENSVLNPPLAFDSSHTGHRAGQALVWDRLYKVIDGLISLLEAEDFGDGTSLWDRTLLYVASDFGREKTRPEGADEWGTGHHLNNGVQVYSPLVPGDTLLGGVDPDTGLTYGFDPVSGEPEEGREMSEDLIFSGLLGALGVDTSGSGLTDVPAMRKG